MAKKSKKNIVRREYTKADVKELSSFKSKNSVSQNREADEKNGRFIASEGVEAWDQTGASQIVGLT